MTSTKTRSDTNVWLVGHLIPVIDFETFKQLPTVGEVLRRLFFYLKHNKATLSESCKNVIEEVFALWFVANIPTTQKQHAISKLRKIYEQHDRLRKNRRRRTERQDNLESDFRSQLNTLFDVSHADCDAQIRIPEDWNFLLDQRGSRNMIMGGEDKLFRKRVEKKQKRIQEESRRVKRAKEEASASASSVPGKINESDVTDVEAEFSEEAKSADECDDQYEVGISKYLEKKIIGPKPPPNAAKRKIHNKRQLLDDPIFVASLDRTRTTPREAMHIVAPALKAVGVDINELTLSTSSIYKSRKVARKSIGESLKHSFDPKTPLVIHFDGKLLPDDDGAKLDRMPVVVSGKNVEKLLAIPKLPAGTGLEMGNSVVQILKDYDGISEWVAGLCFDTTSANTGVHSGAITVIQEAFEKRLLFLACRHHILEIIATAVFDFFFVSLGPQIPLFQRFKEQWGSIDQEKYVSVDEVTRGCELKPSEKEWLETNRKIVIDFLKQQLTNETQPRQDYAEFIKLALLTLGEPIAPGKRDEVPFSPPGAHHRARWMAKGIYCLKIFCFREQFRLSRHELDALRRICLFTVMIYIKPWFNSPSACNAPLNDLCLLQNLESYQTVDEQVAEVALRKLRGQLWYLSEDLIGLSLFSSHVLNEEKKALVAAFQKPEQKEDLRRINSSCVKSFQAKSLSDFATKRSLNLFEALNIDIGFLSSDPETWVDSQDYLSAKDIVSALRVVNDCAERAVKLATDFNQILTHDEDQRQLMFQTVEYHRKLMKMPLKQSLAN